MWSCRRTTSSPFDTGDRRDGGSAASAAPEEHRTKMEKELINMKCHSQRILARDIYIDNDTRATGNNNNDETDYKGYTAAVHQSGQHVHTVAVSSQPMGC